MAVISDIRQFCDYLSARIEHPTTDRAQLLGPVLNDLVKVIYRLQAQVPVNVPDLRLNGNKIYAKRMLQRYQYEVTMLRAEGWSFATPVLRRKALRALELAYITLDAMDRTSA